MTACLVGQWEETQRRKPHVQSSPQHRNSLLRMFVVRAGSRTPQKVSGTCMICCIALPPPPPRALSAFRANVRGQSHVGAITLGSAAFKAFAWVLKATCCLSLCHLFEPLFLCCLDSLVAGEGRPVGVHRDSACVQRQPGRIGSGCVRPPPIPLERQLCTVSSRGRSVLLLRTLSHVVVGCFSLHYTTRRPRKDGRVPTRMWCKTRVCVGDDRSTKFSWFFKPCAFSLSLQAFEVVHRS